MINSSTSQGAMPMNLSQGKSVSLSNQVLQVKLPRRANYAAKAVVSPFLGPGLRVAVGLPGEVGSDPGAGLGQGAQLPERGEKTCM